MLILQLPQSVIHTIETLLDMNNDLCLWGVQFISSQKSKSKFHHKKYGL